MYIEDVHNAPTSFDILANLYDKYEWNSHLCQLARERTIFKIDGEEYYISEIKNLQITFTNIKTDKDIKRYIEDIKDIYITDYVLIPKAGE